MIKSKEEKFMNWQLIINIVDELNFLDNQCLIDISSEEQAILLESIYTQVVNSKVVDWIVVLTQAYREVGWEGEPSKSVLLRFQKHLQYDCK
jgi:hypothetical protein